MPQRVYPNLKVFFRDSDETQEQVARELGISQASLSMIKWGVRQPRLDLALEIARRCHVPLESLIAEQARD